MRPTLLLFAALLAVGAVLFLLLDRAEGPDPDFASTLETRPESHLAPGRQGSAGSTEARESTPGAVDPRVPTPPGEPIATGIRGQVLDERDRPIPGASVRLEPYEPSLRPGGRLETATALARTTTDRDGRFAAAIDARGWLRVVVASPGHGSVAARVPGPPAEVLLRLPAAGVVEVRVLAARGEPVADATVRVSSGEVIHSVRTDEAGLASFDAVAPGRVLAQAEADGYGVVRRGPLAVAAGLTSRLLVHLPPTTRLAGRVVDRGTGGAVAGADVRIQARDASVALDPTGPDGRFGPGAAGAGGSPVLVAVRAEGYAPALWPVHLEDAANGVQEVEIALTRAEAWPGRVVDASRRPVAGATVRYTHDGVTGRDPDATETDDAGRFVLPPPPPPLPGRRVILVAEGAGARAARALRPGDPRPSNLELVLRRDVRVSGRILSGAARRPAAGLKVRLEPQWNEIFDRARPHPATSRLMALQEHGYLALTATTQGDGRWQLRGVPEGVFLLRILTPDGTRYAPETIRVGGDDLDVGDTRLGLGATVKGRTLDASGRPLAGVVVRIASPTPPARVRQVTSDSEGYWQYEDLQLTKARLKASLPGHGDAVAEIAVPAGGPVDLVLAPGARLRGTVRSPDGTPFRGVFTVALVTEGKRGTRPPAPRTFQSAAGTFEFDGIGRGEWRIAVRAASGETGRLPGPLATAPGQIHEIVIDLARPAALRGTLSNSSGRAVARGRVHLRRSESSTVRRLTTGSEGAFGAEALEAGTWQVVASGPGGSPTSRDVMLTSGETAVLDLRLEPGGTLEVEVVGADGSPRVGAYVMLGNRSGGDPASPKPLRTDASGRVRIDDLPVGAVTLRARTGQREAGSTEAQVRADAIGKVILTVSPAPRPPPR